MSPTPLNDVEAMRDAVLFDGPDRAQRTSRFWILLVLASVIAAAGVVADSTATVIGAMIVAPLMTPILGTMLSLVLADRINLVRSGLFVVGGAAVAVAIGWLVGILALNPVVAATNSQVAGRVHPRLIDLLAAVATGVVGSVALVRRDISDTLPGVAIAISLVPPLSVVGLTLESGETGQAMGALLLFLTNVTAILLSGIIVMAVYKVRPPAAADRRAAIIVVGLVSALIFSALTVSSATIIRDTGRERIVSDVADSWAARANWELIDVVTKDDRIVIRVEGQLPAPETDSLRDGLLGRGIDPGDVKVDMLPRAEVLLEA